MNLLNECQKVLISAEFDVDASHSEDLKRLAFESNTILGFVIAYETPAELLASWESDTATAITTYQLALRRAGKKAWNTYVILLARLSATREEAVRLSRIEEDLHTTRKIARAGIGDGVKMRSALLQLLPIQNAPRLEAVDMADEIRLRTSDLSARLVDAFLSSADDNVLAQIFEDPQ